MKNIMMRLGKVSIRLAALCFTVAVFLGSAPSAHASGYGRAPSGLGGPDAAYAPAEALGAAGIVSCLVDGHTRFVANTMINTAFAAKQGLSQKELDARAAGREGVELGANVARLGVPLAVGTCAMSSGGIAAGLTTLGSMVGISAVGGGVALCLAAPVASCAIGGGLYYGVTKLVQMFCD